MPLFWHAHKARSHPHSRRCSSSRTLPLLTFLLVGLSLSCRVCVSDIACCLWNYEALPAIRIRIITNPVITTTTTTIGTIREPTTTITTTTIEETPVTTTITIVEVSWEVVAGVEPFSNWRIRSRLKRLSIKNEQTRRKTCMHHPTLGQREEGLVGRQRVQEPGIRTAVGGHPQVRTTAPMLPRNDGEWTPVRLYLVGFLG